MNLENQLLGAFGERGGRQIRLTKSEYDQSQHELCMGLAQVIWGEKGLVESLGHTWGFVMDPRFSACEKAWHRKVKITGTENKATGGNREVEYGSVIVGDDGSLSTPRMMTLDQYAEIIGEGRHFIRMVQARGADVTEVKNWTDAQLWDLIQQECSNYFTREGEPNHLARTLHSMLRADWLGLIWDYTLVGNIDQWVFAETGDVAPVTDKAADPDQPVVHAEVEYLERALTFRTILRGNVVKVILTLGGPAFARNFAGVELTEYEKDDIMKVVFSLPYEELYKSLPTILPLLDKAKETPYEERENAQLGILKEVSKTQIRRLQTGEIKPLDLLDGGEGALQEELVQLSKVQHDENLVTLLYVLIQADELVKAYPGMQQVIDIVKPLVEKAEPIPGAEFDALLVSLQDITDKATRDAAVCKTED